MKTDSNILCFPSLSKSSSLGILSYCTLFMVSNDVNIDASQHHVSPFLTLYSIKLIKHIESILITGMGSPFLSTTNLRFCTCSCVRDIDSILLHLSGQGLCPASSLYAHNATTASCVAHNKHRMKPSLIDS